ncbi:hypothetical protein ACTWP5_22310 [Streptomyces sp. 4N509B]|uniref:hypothetical protein n=1 Tax=Streptomyces sp. 4N509B TaxID=3457413 RepID=UPI003FD42209
MAGLTRTTHVTRELLGLKFTILGHSSEGTRLARRLCWPAAVAATWAAVLLADGESARHDVLLLLLAVWCAGWMLGPVLASGAGVLRPAFFALMPIERRRLGLALLAASCVGVGPAVTVLSLAALTVHAADVSSAASASASASASATASSTMATPGAIAVALLAVPLSLVLMVALSRLVYALMGSAMGSRLGVTITAIQYGALLAGLTTGWMAVAGVEQGLRTVIEDGLPSESAARALEASPTSWPVLAVEAAGDGRWGTAAGWLLALAGAALVLAVLCSLVLTPRLPRHPRRGRRPLGSRVATGRPLLPDTPLGAVTGKELRQWWRDPWRSLELQCAAWISVFLVVIALPSGNAEILPFAGVAVALMATLCGCNLLGQDGTAFWMTVVGAGPRTVRDDVRGRQAALLILFGPPSVVLTVVFTLLSGAHWAWPLVAATLPALLGAGIGSAVLLSVVAATPGVDPRYRVGPNDAGDVSYQFWIAMSVTPLLTLPTVALAVAGHASGTAWLAGAAILVGLANGVLVAWLLGRIAHRRLAARLPETFVRLRYGRSVASQQQPSGRGWLDAMERNAIRSNQERKPIGT